MVGESPEGALLRLVPCTQKQCLSPWPCQRWRGQDTLRAYGQAAGTPDSEGCPQFAFCGLGAFCGLVAFPSFSAFFV